MFLCWSKLREIPHSYGNGSKIKTQGTMFVYFFVFHWFIARPCTDDFHKKLSSASSHRQSTVHTSISPETQSIWPERAWLASCTMRSLLSKSVVNAISSPCARAPNASAMAMMLCQGHLDRLSRARNTSPRVLGCSSHSETGWMLYIYPFKNLYIYTSYIFIYDIIYIYTCTHTYIYNIIYIYIDTYVYVRVCGHVW